MAKRVVLADTIAVLARILDPKNQEYLHLRMARFPTDLQLIDRKLLLDLAKGDLDKNEGGVAGWRAGTMRRRPSELASTPPFAASRCYRNFLLPGPRPHNVTEDPALRVQRGSAAHGYACIA
ncbi:hypothetical protein RDV64_22450 [Acuticoccus sp. MNP-M23]|uniref:hypothetical protein n=1 Tax=Acuticoccus sp. MNP-M23 TaxID=3072793 RepID=UPI0028168F63|nr:hypothetical protein [Acuticoccus sp. MNP-M23]WMS42779.1 hypothetical protein RDV64_22450 [Acuticoccus sp. MNP-M23]